MSGRAAIPAWARPPLRVGLARCRVLPEPDPDEAPLLAALARLGVDARSVAWDGDELAGFDAVVLRSTWNYHLDPKGFEAWLDRAAAVATVLNPVSAVRRTLHKRYLLELAAAGVPVIPTVLVPRGTVLDPPWDEVVGKPAISCGSWRTWRASGEVARQRLRAEAAERDTLVQPVVPGFQTTGERAIVWIDGAFTHGVRKLPRFEGGEERVESLPGLRGEDLHVARAALAALGEDLLYARVDLVDGPSGPWVSELECIEPSLFLDRSPGTAARLASAIVRRARGGAV